MSNRDQFDYSEKRSFGARYGFVIGILLVVAVVVVIFGKMFSGGKEAPPRRVQEMVMIKPTPPPPPPPPPPPQPQPTPQDAPKEQMMEQTPDQAESKPEPQDTPAPAMGTNVQGNGAADPFGLTGKGGGGSGNGHANSSRFGWYANQVIRSITEALGKNPRTRNANFSVKVRIWSDVAGRVTRAKLAEPTGDLAVDEAIKNEVLVGFQLKEPPPEGMPMPIVMRLTARRPN